ncbi:MAG: DUF6582 domain-containing protein [Chloroflexota bacterium]
MTHVLETRADKPYGDVAYADPGYQDDGKARYPLDSEEHCRSAWSYINQADNADQYTPQQRERIKARILAAGKKYGIEFNSDAGDRTARLAVCTRSYAFEIRSVSRDGRRLVGTVAVFNKRTRIPDRAGDFDEEIVPGFMDRWLRDSGYPVMQFDHGKDPRTGTVPIGKYDVFDHAPHGYDVEGDLFDNPVVEPVRQAIAAGAIRGMSFRMQVTKDTWSPRSRDEPQLRRVEDADVPEAGPVVFPAYRDTSVSVRSILSTFDEDERLELIRELREQAGLATDLPNLTGQRGTWSARGGDPDDEPWEGETSANAQHRQRAYLLRRNSIVLP